MNLRPTSAQELQELVRTSNAGVRPDSRPSFLPRGGGTKTALSRPTEGQTTVEMTGLSGVKEYDPGEYVFVARAGTPLKEIQTLLAQHGQYLPFDPPFVQQGATLGGTVAANLSGSLRQRYGGVRDFILGVQFVDGAGNLVRGGGKVVKNAAGFDLPKLMVGSLGRLGILTEVAFKVFPFPRATATVEFGFEGLEAALEALYKLAGSHFEFHALDLEPPATLVARIGGLPEALQARLENLRTFIGQRGTQPDGDEAQYWAGLNGLNFQATPRPASTAEGGGDWVVKVALTPKKIPALEPLLHGLPHRYMSAGNLLYVQTADPPALDVALKTQGLSGLVLTGAVDNPYLGVNLDQVFATRVRSAMQKR
ncbi:MAG: FAD-binding protein [Meiothermus sp.]|nr:FAD-binding protein [Meiothermus sp.]